MKEIMGTGRNRLCDHILCNKQNVQFGLKVH